MKLENQAQLPQTAPANLANQSIFISGIVNNQSFEFRTDDGVEFEISGNRALGNLDQSQLLVVFRFSDLIKSIDLSQVSNGELISAQNRIPGQQLCPLIDSSAQDLYTCFREGILYYGNLGKDSGDFDLDENDESVK